MTALPAARASRPGRAMRAAASGVVLIALAAGLSACDPHQTGSAAVVGGQRVTETSINHDAAAVLAAFREQRTAAPASDLLIRTLVDRAVDNDLVAQVAKREHITITQGQIDNLIDTNGGRKKLTADFATRDGLWLPPGQIDELALSSLIQIALGNKLAPGGDANAIGTAVNSYKVKLAKEIGVHISPRYGAWNPATLEISGSVNDLSTPAVLTPSPAPSAG